MPLDTLLSVERRDLALKAPFKISGYTFTDNPVLTATVTRGGLSGRGEAAGVYYVGDTADAAADTLRRLSDRLPPDLTRQSLRDLLSPGGARNALDCALWELEARERGEPVWRLAGLEPPRPLLTTVTLGADDPPIMARSAQSFDFARALKLKLTGEGDIDIERVRAVRAARPDVWMGVDPNQGYAPATVEPLVSALMDCRVSLLEQPFKRGSEAQLDGLNLPLPVAADESCLHLGEMEALTGRFDVVNIKLDKCGGLTEGLMMARRAQDMNLKVMVGNMVGTSLAAAPGFVLGQLCDVVDLDGPLFIAEDPKPGVSYKGGDIWCPPEVWGDPASATREAERA